MSEEGVVRKGKKSLPVDEEGFVKKRKLSRAVKKTLAKKKLSKEKEEIDALVAIIQEQAPELDGSVIESATPETHYPAALTFDQLPISRATKSGLKQAKFDQMTAIQRASIPQVSKSDKEKHPFFPHLFFPRPISRRCLAAT